MIKTYVIDLLRRGVAGRAPEIVISSEPDALSASAAVSAAHRVFRSRGLECNADGFRVMERGSGKVIATWYDDSSR